MDSSVENSRKLNDNLLTVAPLPNAQAGGGCISTPVSKKAAQNLATPKPFNCTISPIGTWKFQYFDKSITAQKPTQQLEKNKRKTTKSVGRTQSRAKKSNNVVRFEDFLTSAELPKTTTTNNFDMLKVQAPKIVINEAEVIAEKTLQRCSVAAATPSSDNEEQLDASSAQLTISQFLPAPQQHSTPALVKVMSPYQFAELLCLKRVQAKALESLTPTLKRSKSIKQRVCFEIPEVLKVPNDLIDLEASSATPLDQTTGALKRNSSSNPTMLVDGNTELPQAAKEEADTEPPAERREKTLSHAKRTKSCNNNLEMPDIIELSAENMPEVAAKAAEQQQQFEAAETSVVCVEYPIELATDKENLAPLQKATQPTARHTEKRTKIAKEANKIIHTEKNNIEMLASSRKTIENAPRRSTRTVFNEKRTSLKQVTTKRGSHMQQPAKTLQVCFNNAVENKELSIIAQTLLDRYEQQQEQISYTDMMLQPGKWRKSLHALRISRQKSNEKRDTQSLQKRKSQRKTIQYSQGAAEPADCTLRIDTKQAAKRQVLQRCAQTQPITFQNLALMRNMQQQNCVKIGEGISGEVFLKTDADGAQTVLKIIPIEGALEINGEAQKTFQQILPEIIISMELSGLRESNALHACYADSFVHIKQIACLKGKYPKQLLQLWQEYDERKGSENDDPSVFGSTQLYIMFALANGGQDLEKFMFTNAEQAYYALQQIVLTLAVAEQAYQFEHRDLHWGNVLLLKTTEKHIKYNFDGKQLLLPSKGVRVTIIDYTLSRMTYNNCCLYNDLSQEQELFEASGDYQFDIYRMMRDVLKNNWDVYEPRTNVLWLSYILLKLVNDVNYKSKQTKLHANYLSKLQQLKQTVLQFNSASDFMRHLCKII